MTYSGVLFDLDGTLLDTVALIVRSCQHTFRTALGREVPEAEILKYIGMPLSELMGLYRPDPAAVEEMITTYRTFNLAHHDRLAKLFPGVREALAALAEGGVKLAVVSSKARGGVTRGLNLFDLSRYFGTVVALEDTERHKPDPQPVALALARLGLRPGEALMVGDSPADLEAGRRAGAGTAAVAWSTFPLEELQAEHPDHVLAEMGELLGLCAVG